MGSSSLLRAIGSGLLVVSFWYGSVFAEPGAEHNDAATPASDSPEPWIDTTTALADELVAAITSIYGTDAPHVRLTRNKLWAQGLPIVTPQVLLNEYDRTLRSSADIGKNRSFIQATQALYSAIALATDGSDHLKTLYTLGPASRLGKQQVWNEAHEAFFTLHSAHFPKVMRTNLETAAHLLTLPEDISKALGEDQARVGAMRLKLLGMNQSGPSKRSLELIHAAIKLLAADATISDSTRMLLIDHWGSVASKLHLTESELAELVKKIGALAPVKVAWLVRRNHTWERFGVHTTGPLIAILLNPMTPEAGSERELAFKAMARSLLPSEPVMEMAVHLGFARAKYEAYPSYSYLSYDSTTARSDIEFVLKKDDWDSTFLGTAAYNKLAAEVAGPLYQAAITGFYGHSPDQQYLTTSAPSHDASVENWDRYLDLVQLGDFMSNAQVIALIEDNLKQTDSVSIFRRLITFARGFDVFPTKKIALERSNDLARWQMAPQEWSELVEDDRFSLDQILGVEPVPYLLHALTRYIEDPDRFDRPKVDTRAEEIAAKIKGQALAPETVYRTVRTLNSFQLPRVLTYVERAFGEELYQNRTLEVLSGALMTKLAVYDRVEYSQDKSWVSILRKSLEAGLLYASCKQKPFSEVLLDQLRDMTLYLESPARDSAFPIMISLMTVALSDQELNRAAEIIARAVADGYISATVQRRMSEAAARTQRYRETDLGEQLWLEAPSSIEVAQDKARRCLDRLKGASDYFLERSRRLGQRFGLATATTDSE